MVPPDDPQQRLYCSNQGCWDMQSKFRLDAAEVELRLVVSDIKMIVMPNGINQQEFRKGYVESLECANCGKRYPWNCAYDPA